MPFQRIGHLKTVAAFRAYLRELSLDLPVDEGIISAAQGSPLAAPLTVRDFNVGNRWCVHPMEGWDGTADGRPSEHTIRRWKHFGLSGAKLIWGGEAFAVRADGRANPNQLYFRTENAEAMRGLLRTLRGAHEERFGQGACDDLLVGLQLTHSGRYAKPNHKMKWEPRIAYHHPLLDRRIGIDANDDAVVFTDDEIKRLIAEFVYVATWAHQVGFQFVDIKACHGYLGHEFLSAFDRPGPYGGDFAGRTRFLREIVEGIRAACPTLLIGVRLSAFDLAPFVAGRASDSTWPARESNSGWPGRESNSGWPGLKSAEAPERESLDVRSGACAEPPAPATRRDTDAVKPEALEGRPSPQPSPGGRGGQNRGMPEDYSRCLPYPGFGCDRGNPLAIDLTEPVRLLEMMRDDLKVDLVNLTAGSPYYNPHIQRPAFFPPSDGYAPPEDPLVGCVRQIHAVRELKQRVPGLPMVGTAYTYFQEYLPHVTQALVRSGWVDSIGIGRLVLSYPDLPMDCLQHGELRRAKLICRTFSDCTTAPRNGIISGCYPLDDHYKDSPEAQQLKQAKASQREKLKTK